MTTKPNELCEMLIATAAKDAERYIKQQKFLEDQIKILIGAIRTAPDLESLKAVARETVERLRKRSLEAEKVLLHLKQDEAAKSGPQ